jgi:hypothetical protein
VLIDQVFQASNAERCLIRAGSMALSAMCANDAGCGRHAGIPPRTALEATGYRRGWPALCALTFATYLDNKREHWHCIASQTTVRAQNSTALHILPLTLQRLLLSLLPNMST